MSLLYFVEQGRFFYMDSLRRLAFNAANLNPEKIIDQVFESKPFQDLMVFLNTEKQLSEQGVNSLGVSLVEVGGVLAVSTQIKKKRKGQPTFPALKDTGDYHDTFAVKIVPEGALITSNPIKNGYNILERWGKEVEGLTDESIAELIQFFREAIIALVRTELFRGVR